MECIGEILKTEKEYSDQNLLLFNPMASTWHKWTACTLANTSGERRAVSVMLYPYRDNKAGKLYETT